MMHRLEEENLHASACGAGKDHMCVACLVTARSNIVEICVCAYELGFCDRKNLPVEKN